MDCSTSADTPATSKHTWKPPTIAEPLYEDAPAVTDGDLITASGLAPLEFAQHIFRRLALYRPAVLDAWYSLFKTGDVRYYYSLLQTAQ